MNVDLRPAKDAALSSLPCGHPVRECLAVQPDTLPPAEVDALLSLLLRLRHVRTEP